MSGTPKTQIDTVVQIIGLFGNQRVGGGTLLECQLTWTRGPGVRPQLLPPPRL